MTSDNIMLSSESDVEHFGKFIYHMKEAVAKVRGKFIDHCNQMSGRKQTHTHTHMLEYIVELALFDLFQLLLPSSTRWQQSSIA